ncbi:MAG TPA: type I 3-dehydroquinate dehydratase [Tepidisphaeraceae bacterium]|nr:type I 3-dehydroquinate dehydratase [Tepidisphaeraceae bacterium]
MTRLCAAIFVSDLAQARRDAVAAAEAGAEMVELRVDELTGHEQVRALIRECPLPCIVTCRPTWEGGQCDLPEGERMAVLEVAANVPATYIDVELKAYRQFAVLGEVNASVPRDHRPGLIVSAHDFAGRPPRLNNLLAEMAESTADVHKIVWTARTLRDNLEAFEILRRAAKPTIALCMGEAGLISRVLAKKFGAFLTFASLRKERETAPGQVSIDEMKRLYRWDAIRRTTKVYGVVGSPVAHSMSPAIHNAAFDQAGYDGVYLPLLVNEGYESFKAFMESFLAFTPLDLSGLSITIPHKENALKYLREKNADIDPLAIKIGAVNTIRIDRQSESGAPVLEGFNTDYGAILDSITSKLGIQRQGLAGKRVAVIGAGGTGRTAVAALAHYGATVVVYNRSRDRADALAAEFNGRSGKVVAAPLDKLCDSCCEIYLNTTSVGMHPNVDASPLGERPPKLNAETLVFDTVYNPIKTKLLRQAEAAGAPTIGGIEMFVRQAVAQFESWTKLPAPTEVMRWVVETRLGAK